jgi:hypothetical protein
MCEACACCAGQGDAEQKLFLVKSEPHDYSVDDLAAEKSGVGIWDGVRSYQARNVLRSLAPGDQGLFYHSQRGKARPPVQAALQDPRAQPACPLPWKANNATTEYKETVLQNPTVAHNILALTSYACCAHDVDNVVLQAGR